MVFIYRNKYIFPGDDDWTANDKTRIILKDSSPLSISVSGLLIHCKKILVWKYYKKTTDTEDYIGS